MTRVVANLYLLLYDNAKLNVVKAPQGFVSITCTLVYRNTVYIHKDPVTLPRNLQGVTARSCNRGCLLYYRGYGSEGVFVPGGERLPA